VILEFFTLLYMHHYYLSEISMAAVPLPRRCHRGGRGAAPATGSSLPSRRGAATYFSLLSRRGSGNLVFLPLRRGAAAVDFLEIFLLFLSKNLIMIEMDGWVRGRVWLTTPSPTHPPTSTPTPTHRHPHTPPPPTLR
jgi:hypothetical protein